MVRPLLTSIQKGVIFQVALLCAATPLLAQQGGAQSDVRPERAEIPFILERGPGTYDLWSVDEFTGTEVLAIENLVFQPVELVGYAVKDRLRIDMPAQGPFRLDPDEAPLTAVPDHVRLPVSGRLYHILRNGWSELLVVRGERLPRIVLSLPSPAGGSAIDPKLSVSVHGQYALVATTTDAGGDVYRVDLSGDTAPTNLTAHLAPLEVDASSLRVSADGAWFLAGDILYLATAPDWEAAPVPLPLIPEETPLPESVLAFGGRYLALLVEGSGDARRVLLTDIFGTTQVITATAGDYCLPGLQDPLGPHLAVDPDGQFVAYCAIETTKEVYLRPVGAAPIHLSAPPLFQETLDNVAALGFGTGTHHSVSGIDNVGVLSFFGGSDQISGLTGKEVLGAADMYVALVDAQGGIGVINLTRTSGQLDPPFDPPGALTISQPLLDPLGQRILMQGETPEEAYELSVLYLDGGDNWPLPNVQVLLTGLEEEPAVYPVGRRVLVLSAADDSPYPASSAFLLQPRSPGFQEFSQIAAFPLGAELSRVDSRQGQALFVARSPQGIDMPYLVRLRDGETSPALPPSWNQALGPAPSLSHGTIFTGVGGVQGPWSWLRIDDPTHVAPLDLPQGQGLVLPH